MRAIVLCTGRHENFKRIPSHQTGWSGVIARIAHLFASFEAQEVLEQSKGESAGQTAARREK